MQVRRVRPYDSFPGGDSRALAELRFDPDEPAKRFGLSVEEVCNDLDWSTIAAIALPDRSQAWLTKYRGEQGPGTTVSVDAAADLATVKELPTRALGLTEDDFRWVAPGLERAPARA